MAKQFCVHCGGPLETNASFCSGCGAYPKEYYSSSRPTWWRAWARSQVLAGFCRYCGGPLETNASFCSGCGTYSKGSGFPDNARDGLFAGLQALGMLAQMSDRCRPEEHITSSWDTESLGVIDLLGSVPIRWGNVKKKLGWYFSDYDVYYEYGVPDFNMRPTYPSVHIKSIRAKTLIGKVIGLRWEGRDFGLGILSRLTDDVSLAQPIIDSPDLEIRAYPEHGCYLLTTRWSRPSNRLWNCYQTIAGHLLLNGGMKPGVEGSPESSTDA